MFRRIRLHIPGQIGPPVVGALSRKDDPPEGTRHYWYLSSITNEEHSWSIAQENEEKAYRCVGCLGSNMLDEELKQLAKVKNFRVHWSETNKINTYKLPLNLVRHFNWNADYIPDRDLRSKIWCFAVASNARPILCIPLSVLYEWLTVFFSGWSHQPEAKLTIGWRNVKSLRPRRGLFLDRETTRNATMDETPEAEEPCRVLKLDYYCNVIALMRDLPNMEQSEEQQTKVASCLQEISENLDVSQSPPLYELTFLINLGPNSILFPIKSSFVCCFLTRCQLCSTTSRMGKRITFQHIMVIRFASSFSRFCTDFPLVRFAMKYQRYCQLFTSLLRLCWLHCVLIIAIITSSFHIYL